jgi:hypothetical protein
MKVVLQTKRDLTQSDRQSIYDAIFMFDYGLKSYHFINSDNYSLELSDISQKHITQPEPQQVRGCSTCGFDESDDPVVWTENCHICLLKFPTCGIYCESTTLPTEAGD